MRIKGRLIGLLAARALSAKFIFQELLPPRRELLGRREALRCPPHSSI